MRNGNQTAYARAGKNSPAEPRCWEDIDQHLARLGEIERQTAVLQSRLNRKVAELKQEALEASQELGQEQERLRQQMERFYWAHRNELLAAGCKSLELAFGRLGSRRSRSVVVEDAEAAQQWLSAHGLRRFLRIRTEMDREAIRSVLLAPDSPREEETTALLACPVIRLRESEQFWYEVNLPGGSLGNRTGKSAGTSNKSRERSRVAVERSHEGVSWGGSHERTVQQTT